MLSVSVKGPDESQAYVSMTDALNINRTHGLRIVATGSNRDKLSMLRSSKDQAFFGAPLTTFPPLGEEYVRRFIEGKQLSDVLEVDIVTQWFVYAGHRPEILSAAADAELYEIGAIVLAPNSRYRESVMPLSACKVKPATAGEPDEDEPDLRAGRRKGLCCTLKGIKAKRLKQVFNGAALMPLGAGIDVSVCSARGGPT